MKRIVYWSLAGTLLMANISVADTPLKGGKPVFGTPQAPVTTSTTGRSVDSAKPAVVDPKVSQTSFEKSRDVVPVVPPTVMPVDHSVKAASIEVAWLQQPLTYPLHLRAECKPGEEAITITGYLPHDRMREKVLAIARSQCGTVPLVDQMMVQPLMVLPSEVPVDGEQAFLVKVALERVSAGLSNGLELTVDAQGIVTVTGRVDELVDRRKIIRGLQGIPGCTAVKYNLSVPAPTKQSMVTVVPSITLSPVTQVEAKTEVKKSVVTPPAVVVPPLDLKLPGEADRQPPPPPKFPFTKVDSKPALVPVIPVVPAVPVVAKVEKQKPVEPPVVLVPPLDLKPTTPVVPVKPVVAEVEKMIATSSQSGLFPPGVTGLTPSLTASSITLGSPIICRTVVAPSSVVETPIVQVEARVESIILAPAARVHVTRPITLSVMSQAVSEAMPAEVEPAPMLIPVMPRKVSTAVSRRVIP
jgi:hypothetical protein